MTMPVQYLDRHCQRKTLTCPALPLPGLSVLDVTAAERFDTLPLLLLYSFLYPLFLSANRLSRFLRLDKPRKASNINGLAFAGSFNLAALEHRADR